MSEVLFRKTVDRSLLKEGTTLPRAIQDKLMTSIGVVLSRGQKSNINVVIDGAVYEAILTYVDLHVSARDVVQIRYSEGSGLCRALKKIFAKTELAFSRGESLSESESGYIEVYAAGQSKLEIRCYPAMTKNDFLQYIGDVNNLSGYQRSYKLVFYKCFFELFKTKREVSAYTLSVAFREFYLNRKKQGLTVDVATDPLIENVESSSPERIYKFILQNPFAAISGKGFISQVEHDGKMYFQLAQSLDAELTEKDVNYILDLVEKKLAFYYSKIDPAAKEKTPMRDMINRILNEYESAKNGGFVNHPLGVYFRNDVPLIIYKTGIVDSTDYLITGSVGKGNWALVPWVCIFDREITTSATRGIYIAYLLSSDGKTLYLTFNQGCTDLKNQRGKREAIKYMREQAAILSAKLDSRGFASDENINLGENLTDLGELYEKGTIFYTAYHQGAVPSEETLQEDLRKMMEIYREYKYGPDIADPEEPEEELFEEIDDGEEVSTLTAKETIEHVKKYIASKGFTYPSGLIENFYLSLKSKPFVILAGTSGTGKTRLVKLFAEAIGATSANGQYKMVSVRPDWSDSTDLFGHVDLQGKFIPGVIIDFVKKASMDLAHPYILCLDEMNLARVEYYLSDVLSIIETRDFTGSKIETDPLIPASYYGADQKAAMSYGELGLPENLYIVGTVNMDETTFPFSKKVLDRANTIEFSFVDLMPQLQLDEEAPAPIKAANAFLKTKYLLLAQCNESAEAVGEFCSELQQINKILQRANAHVGYRVRDEIVFYLLNNAELDLLSVNDAMDNAIMQKILPRIQGSSGAVKDMLCELFKVFAGDYAGYQTEDNDVSTKMLRAAQSSECKYKKSAEKIAFMVRRFEEDGFTSYWL